MKTVPSRIWQRSISDYPALLHLAPIVTHPESSLTEIVAALAADPRPRAVFVTDADDHLLGWIHERKLDADLLLMILPGDFARTMGEIDMRDVMRAARGRTQTARDLLSEARTITPETSLREAVIVTARGGDHVAALVDEDRRLLGYVTLLDLLAELLRSGA